MGKAYWILAVPFILLFLEGCATGNAVLDVNSSQNATLHEDVPNNTLQTSSKDAPVDASNKNTEEKRLKKLEALGFGIFNYTELTLENCDDSYAALIDTIGEIEDDLKDAKDTFKKRQATLEELLSQMPEAEASGNSHTINALQDDIENERDAHDEARKELDDTQDLFHKYQIIREQIKKYCLELKAGS